MTILASFNYKYDYTICTVAEEEIYTSPCRALEKHIPGLVKDELLHDVDDSKVQIYYLNGQRLSVHNSYYIDAVFIKSEFDIDPYFE